MKTKLEKIQAKYNAAQGLKVRLETDINELKSRQPVLLDEAKKRAEAGDIDEYIRLRDQADRIGAEIHVKELQLKKAAAPIEKDEAIAAWKEYIKTADAAFEKKLEAYKKAKRELCTMLKDLVRDRENAKMIRELLALYCGTDKSSMLPYEYKDAVSKFSMKPFTPREAQDDCNFFRKSGMITQEEATNIQLLLFSFIS